MKLRSLLARWRRGVLLAMVPALPFALLSASVPMMADGPCEHLVGVAMPAARITRTEVVPAGATPFHASRAFCRVFTTMTPTSDSDIKVEVWLPMDGWNGNFQAVGNGDAAGVISYAAMANAVSRGDATSSTDTGHVGNTLEFALGHREKYIDFGYRSLHEMTLKAKTVIGALYGRPPQLSLE